MLSIGGRPSGLVSEWDTYPPRKARRIRPLLGAGQALCCGELEKLLASEKVHVFNDLNFETEVLASGVPVLVDFTATWCGPCKALAPIVDQIATELDGKIKVGKLDVDDSPLTAGKYGVRGVPTVMVFKNGERAAQHVGLTTKQKLLALVET